MHAASPRDCAPRRMAEALETGKPPPFRFPRVDRWGLVVAPAGMARVIAAAAYRAARPIVDHIEGERHMRGNGGMEALDGLPGAKPNCRNGLASRAGGGERQGVAIARDRVAIRARAADKHLNALERGVDRSGGAAWTALLAQDQPRLERLPQLHRYAGPLEAAPDRKAKRRVGQKPLGLQRHAGGAQIG